MCSTSGRCNACWAPAAAACLDLVRPGDEASNECYDATRLKYRSAPMGALQLRLKCSSSAPALRQESMLLAEMLVFSLMMGCTSESCMMDSVPTAGDVLQLLHPEQDLARPFTSPVSSIL